MQKIKSFQDQLPFDHCFASGVNNQLGLSLKSYWRDENTAVARFTPAAQYSGGSLNYLSGGIIATLIDAHAIATARAEAYADAGREIGSGETIAFVIGSLEVNYLYPVPMGEELAITASVIEEQQNKTTIYCELLSAQKLCITANVIAVKVAETWASD